MQRGLTGNVDVVQVGAAVDEERGAGNVTLPDGQVEQSVARRQVLSELEYRPSDGLLSMFLSCWLRSTFISVIAVNNVQNRLKLNKSLD